MPTFFHKPENALKRAHEFIEVGKKVSALEVLNDVIRSRKHRQKWTTVHENIMVLYTDLCVQLQRSSYAKDGLYQYRNICKEVAPSSFEKVVKGFLKMAEDRAGKARETSEATVLQEVEDLDVVMTPESLLLSTVSGEGAKERTDRVLLTPWVKFLWESYRNMLELLKNNLTNLTVYADVAKNAFKFCLNYQRRTEYRKLCEILRNHLAQAEKYQTQQHSLKLDQPEVIQSLVDVRFEQLESSITVDLWQEAFRAIEEIHKLLTMSGKSPKPGLLENFYSRQAKVYLMANNQLFHAAALHKLFVLRKEQKKTLTEKEAQITASQVLLATLCVPIEPVPSETDRFLEVDDNLRDKARRLAGLLRMPTPPTRALLMKDVLYYNVLQLLPLELQQLYQYLEVDFDPLHLCEHVMPILEGLKEQEQCTQYVKPLESIILVRLIKQVSQVYQTIELSRLVELAPFTNTTDLEKVVVETASSNGIQVHIDHRTKSLCFGMNLNFSHRTEGPEGPHVQSMPSELLCNQLTMMSQALQQAVHIIASSEIQAEQQAAAKKAYHDYQTHCHRDHRRTLQRRQEIEARKEFIESRDKAKIKQAEEQLRQKHQLEREEERKRLDREAVQREIERKRKEMEEMQMKMKQEKVDAFKNTPVGKRAFADITDEDLKNMDAEVIFSKQLKQIEKEKKDKETRLKTQEKKVDYFERAKRVVEIDELKQQYEEQREADRQFHEEQDEQKIVQAVKEREEAVEASARLKVMRGDAAKFQETIQAERKKKLAEKLAVFQENLADVREKRLAKRKQERKEKRKAEHAAAKREEEARKVQLRREEEERKKEEERRKRDEEREQQRLLAAKREAEAEERLRRKEQQEMEIMKKGDREWKPPTDETSDWRKKTEKVEQEMEPENTTQQGRTGGAYRPPGMTRGRNMEQYRSPRGERREVGGRDERDWRRGGDESPPRDDRRGRSPRDDRRGRWDDEPRRERDDRDNWKGGRGRWDEGGENWRRGRPGEDGDGWRDRDDRERGRRWGDEDLRRDDRDGWRGRQRDDEPRRDDRESWRSGDGGRDSGPLRRFDGDRTPRSGDHWREGEDRTPRRGYDRDNDRPPRRGYDREEDRTPRRGYDRDDDRPTHRGYDRDDDRPPRWGYDRDDHPRRGFEGDRSRPWRGRDAAEDRRGPPPRGDREDQGEKWRRGGDRLGDRGEGKWRDSDRSPGRGRDRGQPDGSPSRRHVDEEGFEVVNRRR